MERTIIDILNVADQERFHSSMIAWLLDPKGEHGLGHAFGDKLLGEFPETAEAKVQRVEIEKVESGVRYDIWMQTEDPKKTIVLENKMKSFGGESQLKTYRTKIGQGVVIALGLDDLNFDEAERKAFPFICYRDVLDALHMLGGQAHEEGFKSLVQHHRVFLARELGRLECVRRAFDHNEDEARNEIERDGEEWIRKNDNNRRFYNSFYLALLRRRLGTGQYRGIRWTINKDVQSGVVMYQANPQDDEHPRWALESCHWDAACLKAHLLQYQQEPGKWNTSFWIEIELDDGIFAAKGAPCGEMRLKASLYEHSRATAREIQQKFESAYRPSAEEDFPKRHAGAKNDTFTLLHRPIRREDLILGSMEEILGQWHDKHGLRLR